MSSDALRVVFGEATEGNDSSNTAKVKYIFFSKYVFRGFSYIIITPSFYAQCAKNIYSSETSLISQHIAVRYGIAKYEGKVVPVLK